MDFGGHKIILKRKNQLARNKEDIDRYMYGLNENRTYLQTHSSNFEIINYTHVAESLKMGGDVVETKITAN